LATAGLMLMTMAGENSIVSRFLPKIGFTLAEGPAHVGQVTVVDIGVPKELVDSIE
jgi:hypothetical protein